MGRHRWWWTVDRLVELRVPNLETFSCKREKKLTCHTIAHFTGNGAVALASCSFRGEVLITSSQSLDRSGLQGESRNESEEILFQSFLREVLVSCSGMGREVHSLMLSIKHFLCRPRRRPPSKVP